MVWVEGLTCLWLASLVRAGDIARNHINNPDAYHYSDPDSYQYSDPSPYADSYSSANHPYPSYSSQESGNQLYCPVEYVFASGGPYHYSLVANNMENHGFYHGSSNHGHINEGSCPVNAFEHPFGNPDHRPRHHRLGFGNRLRRNSNKKEKPFEILVFELDYKNFDQSPKISTETAKYYFSKELNIHQECPIESIDQLNKIYKRKLSRKNGKTKLFVSLHGVADAQEFFYGVKPNFLIEGIGMKQMLRFDVYFNRKLVYKIIELKIKSFLKRFRRGFKLITSNEKYQTEANWESSFNIWDKLNKVPNLNLILNFDLGHIRFINEKPFFDLLANLIDINDLEELSQDEILYILSPTFVFLGEKYGHDSLTYKFVKRIIGDYIVYLSHNYDTTVILYPAMNPKDKEDGKIQPFSNDDDANRRSLIEHIPQSSSYVSCFINEEICKFKTSNCNSKGICVETTSGCWQCLCSSVFNEETSITSSWSGFDCTTEEQSLDRNAFSWSSLGYIIRILGGIKFLIDISGESIFY